MSNRSIVLLVVAAIAAFLLTQTLYTVDPTKLVLVRQFGAIVGKAKTEPGLYAKVPLVQDVVRIDSRLLDYEAEEFEIIARASGDAQRFDQVYGQWAKAKDITTERLYLDTMEEVLRNVNKVMIDKNSAGSGVVPYLPLPELKTTPPVGGPPRQTPPPPAAAGATR